MLQTPTFMIVPLPMLLSVARNEVVPSLTSPSASTFIGTECLSPTPTPQEPELLPPVPARLPLADSESHSLSYQSQQSAPATDKEMKIIHKVTWSCDATKFPRLGFT